MTCQWCVHYRRRRGGITCVRPGGDGKVVPKNKGNINCPCFDARKSCTTCEHRCSIDEKMARIDESGKCSSWNLRKIESWGGYRKVPGWRARAVISKQKQEKERTHEEVDGCCGGDRRDDRVL